MANANPDNELPRSYKLGEYVIESVLGHGGFGITYLATDTKLSSRVAIKEYFPQAYAFRNRQSTIIPKSDGAENYRWGLQEFLKEARALAKFKHNHIVRVLRFLETNGTAYMVMEYEQGESLANYLRKSGGYLNEATLWSVFLPILSGLQAVHDAGLLHLDIKPDNIYLRTNGQPMLIDFGSARQTKGSSQQNQKIAFTPAYAAIEHYPNHGQQGPWTDVYSIGATLYRCISGGQPVSAMVRYEAFRQQKTDPLKSATTFDRPLYAPYIRESVDWAMKLSPKDRPYTAFALQRGLMGHGMSNDKPTPQSAVNYRSGFIGIAKVRQKDQETRQGVFGKALIGLLIIAAFGIFSLKYLLENKTITETQLFDGIAYVETAVRDIAKKTESGVRQALHLPPDRRVKDAKPPLPVRQNKPVEQVRVAPFDTSKVLVHTFSGHGEGIRSLAFLLNGRLLASASIDGVVKLWNVETGVVEHTFSDVENTSGTVTVSPNGRWLATTGSDNTIKLWDAKDDSSKGELIGHAGRINHLAFSPDGRTLASASLDHSVILWDIKEQRLGRQITGYKHDVLTIAFSPNGRRFATGDANGEIKYWETSTGKLVGYFQAHEEKVNAIAFSPDGKWLASGGPKNFLKLWDTGLELRDRVLNGAPDTVHAMAFSPDGKWLIVAGTSNAIQMWDIKTGELGHQLYGYNHNIYSVALSPDGLLLAAGGDDESVRVWK